MKLVSHEAFIAADSRNQKPSSRCRHEHQEDDEPTAGTEIARLEVLEDRY